MKRSTDRSTTIVRNMQPGVQFSDAGLQQGTAYAAIRTSLEFAKPLRRQLRVSGFPQGILYRPTNVRREIVTPSSARERPTPVRGPHRSLPFMTSRQLASTPTGTASIFASIARGRNDGSCAPSSVASVGTSGSEAALRFSPRAKQDPRLRRNERWKERRLPRAFLGQAMTAGPLTDDERESGHLRRRRDH